MEGFQNAFSSLIVALATIMLAACAVSLLRANAFLRKLALAEGLPAIAALCRAAPGGVRETAREKWNRASEEALSRAKTVREWNDARMNAASAFAERAVRGECKAWHAWLAMPLSREEAEYASLADARRAIPEVVRAQVAGKCFDYWTAEIALARDVGDLEKMRPFVWGFLHADIGKKMAALEKRK